MSSFSRLLAAGGAAHFADQLATAALPLTAVIVLGAGPGTVGTLVALQGLAWLLASLPAGVLVDRVPKGLLIALSQAGAGLAFAAATVAATAGSGTSVTELSIGAGSFRLSQRLSAFRHGDSTSA